jgi:hypothetical protein
MLRETLTKRAAKYNDVFDVQIAQEQAGKIVEIRGQSIEVPEFEDEQYRRLLWSSLGMTYSQMECFDRHQHDKINHLVLNSAYYMGFPRNRPVTRAGVVHRAFQLGILCIGATYDAERWPIEDLSPRQAASLWLMSEGYDAPEAAKQLSCEVDQHNGRLKDQHNGRLKEVRRKLGRVPNAEVAVTATHYAGLFSGIQEMLRTAAPIRKSHERKSNPAPSH